MGAFVEQLERYGATLAAAQSPVDGGWPHDLLERDAALSLACTAHAVDILRYLARPYGADDVSGGLGYLAGQVRMQLRPGRRGPYNRYAAYALWGLTRYRETSADEAYGTAFDFCISWLEDNELAGGGWPTKAGGSQQLSLVATMPAVRALDRLTFDPRLGARAAALLDRARTGILAAGRRRVRTAPLTWTHGERSGPAAGPTALAVLALASSADEGQRADARAAARWLLERSQQWAGEVEADLLLTQAHWRILTFSLGIRAVLAAGAAGPADGRLSPALGALAALWDPETDAWSVQPGEPGSTTGSFGVVSAVRAASHTWRFDPFDGLPVRFARPPRRRPKARRRLLLRLRVDSSCLEIFDTGQETPKFRLVLTPRQLATVKFAAQRHIAGVYAHSLLQRSFTQDELASALGVASDSARRYVDRLNRALEDRWQTRLIEEVVLPGDAATVRGPRRYAVDAYEIELVGAEGAQSDPEQHGC